jgi:endogenous inhibitor of DNA gyrase (YacG/DUF329 family)
MCQAHLDEQQPPETRPFCSPRCKKLDLANWLSGNYRLPRELLPEEIVELPADQQEQLLLALLGDHKGTVH